jgi:fructokinase
MRAGLVEHVERAVGAVAVRLEEVGEPHRGDERIIGVSGPALAREKSARGEENAWALYADRLARAFSLIVNFLDPEIIVVGGGVSKEQRIYASVPQLLPRYVYTQNFETPIVPAQHGDASGVRGAAMLWPQ